MRTTMKKSKALRDREFFDELGKVFVAGVHEGVRYMQETMKDFSPGWEQELSRRFMAGYAEAIEPGVTVASLAALAESTIEPIPESTPESRAAMAWDLFRIDENSPCLICDGTGMVREPYKGGPNNPGPFWHCPLCTRDA